MRYQIKLLLCILFFFLTSEVFAHGKSHKPKSKDVAFGRETHHMNMKMLKALAMSQKPVNKPNVLKKTDYFSTHNQRLSEDKAFVYKLTEPVLLAAPPDALPNAAAGAWSNVFEWDIVAVHATLLPNGKVLVWDATPDDFDGVDLPDRTTITRVRLWDPASRAIQPINYNQSDLFCAGSSHLWDGRVLFTGGDTGKQGINKGDTQSTIYDPYSNTWEKTGDMQAPRWYASVVSLPNGEMLTLGGTNLAPFSKPTNYVYSEVFQFDKTWRALTNVPSAYGDNSTGDYQWLQTKPNGDVIVLGPHTDIQNIKTSGAGQFLFRDKRDQIYRGYGSYALYEHDKALISGGGLPKSFPGEGAVNSAVIINLNDDSVAVTSPMNFPRRQHNLTILADGTVLASGGIKGKENLIDTNVENQIMAAEIWKDGNWTTMSEMKVTRQYHSVALLLTDGSVLHAGGGYCGDCLTANFPNKYDYEIYYPPYLYKAGSEVRIPNSQRLNLYNVPDEINYNEEFKIDLSKNTTIQKAHFIKLGSVTHSQNQGQRLVKTTFQKISNTGYNVKAPLNRNIAPPGHYMLILVDQSGEPSIGKVIKIGQPLLKSGDVVKDKLLQIGKWNYYRVDPNGQKTINVTLSGLTANADVFIEQNFYPDDNSLQDKKTGNTTENLSATGDPQAPWYIGVKGDLGVNYNLTINLNNAGTNTVTVPTVQVAEGNAVNFKLLCYSATAGELMWDYNRDLYSGFDIVVDEQIVETVDQASYYINDFRTKFDFVQNKANIREINFHLTPVLKQGAPDQTRMTYMAEYDDNCGMGTPDPVVTPGPVAPTGNGDIDLEFMQYSRFSGELMWKYDRTVHSGFIVSVNGTELYTLDAGSFYIADIRQEAVFLAGTNNIADINFNVTPLDLAGNRVGAVGPVTEPVITPVIPQVPNVVGGAQTNLTGIVYSQTALELSWDKLAGVNEYTVYANGVVLRAVNGGSLWLEGLIPGTNYTFQLFTNNGAGALVASSNSLTLSLGGPVTPVNPNPGPGVTPVTPQVPNPGGGGDITVTGIVYSQTALELSWEKITGINEYVVYVNGDVLRTVNGSSLWLDKLEPDTNYTFQVYTKNTAGALVPNSNSLTLKTN